MAALDTRHDQGGASRSAFTLIEVLVVVVIVAVLAALIIPGYLDSAEDSKASVVKHNLHALRMQINLYKMHHLGLPPELQGQQLPQLSSPTNSSGDIGSGAPDHPCGPYIVSMPDNPYNGLNTVAAVGSIPPTTEASNAGWLYHQASGQIWPNRSEFFAE